MEQNILIVDDTPDDAGAMKAALESEGYKVSCSNSGSDALEELSKTQFKLILLDINMPVLSGYDLARLMRQRISHKAKIIYISIVPKQEILMDDIDGFIQKPFSPETLLAGVKKVLKK